MDTSDSVLGHVLHDDWLVARAYTWYHAVLIHTGGTLSRIASKGCHDHHYHAQPRGPTLITLSFGLRPGPARRTSVVSVGSISTERAILLYGEFIRGF